jgi:multidrug resistance efflux pump
MSQAEAQAAKAEAQAARNALGAARAGLAIARKDASLHVVRAPGDGYVTARLAQLGSVATPDNSCSR